MLVRFSEKKLSQVRSDGGADDGLDHEESLQTQLCSLEGLAGDLVEIKRQIDEIRCSNKQNRHQQLDKKLLDAYLVQAIEQTSLIEHSLDRGIVGLPAIEVENQVEQNRAELPKPRISQTPYSQEMSSLIDFFDEVKNSEISKRGIYDFTTGTVKSSVLPRHLKDIGDASIE